MHQTWAGIDQSGVELYQARPCLQLLLRVPGRHDPPDRHDWQAASRPFCDPGDQRGALLTQRQPAQTRLPGSPAPPGCPETRLMRCG